MSDWITVFDSTFWLSLSVGFFGFLGLALRYCIKSKCSDTSCCYGMISIKRDTQAELEESEFEYSHGIPPGVAPANVSNNVY